MYCSAANCPSRLPFITLLTTAFPWVLPFAYAKRFPVELVAVWIDQVCAAHCTSRRDSAQPHVAFLDQRPEQGDQTKDHDCADKTVGEEHAERTLRPEQRLPECFFRLVAEH